MDTRDIYKLVRELSEEHDDVINLYDSMDIELNEGFVIETGVVGFMEDGVIVHLDEDAMEFLDFNGVLLESEDLSETYTSDESPVYNAILNRIMRQHLELLSKYGPAAVMAAVEDVTHSVPTDLDEIGSSDVSIWTKQAIEYLEAGHYKHLHEDDGFGDVDAFKSKLSRSTDPFEMIYNALSGDYGEDVRVAFQEMYDDIVIDSHGRLHPDDDFETIINTIVDQYVDDGEGYEDDHLDELAAIKKLALGEGHSSKKECPHCHGTGGHDRLTVKGGHHTVPCNKCGGTGEVDNDDEEVTEGLGKVLLGGAALLAALTGINKYEASQMMKNDPQLAKLAHFREVAQQKGDEEKVRELDDRIRTTMDHLTVTGDEVRDEMGRAIDPVYEAEYQGRKVPLGKPMQGDVKKSKVYVRKPNGKVVKVNFGDKNMRIKKNSPGHRKSFRARHHCENPGPRWKARYWSCRAW